MTIQDKIKKASLLTRGAILHAPAIRALTIIDRHADINSECIEELNDLLAYTESAEYNPIIEKRMVYAICY